jgi:hypothetical protein
MCYVTCASFGATEPQLKKRKGFRRFAGSVAYLFPCRSESFLACPEKRLALQVAPTLWNSSSNIRRVVNTPRGTFFLYGPLFLAAFILSVIAMASAASPLVSRF